MMPQGIIRTVVKLLAASLLVGLVMRWLGLTPRALIANFGTAAERLFNAAAHFAGWAIDYILIGAVVVVPIWLIVVLIDRAKRKPGR